MSAIRIPHVLVATNVLLLAALALPNGKAVSEPAVAEVGILRAQAIQLVNEKGEVRGGLHLTKEGGGELRLASPEGEVRVKLGTTADGAILLLLDKSTEPGIRLATEHPGPSLKLIDPTKGEKIVAP